MKDRLGHEDVKTTVNPHRHLVPHGDEAIADSLSELFEAAQGGATDETNVVDLTNV